MPLTTVLNLNKYPRSHYPGYQKFFLARGGRKFFASLRRPKAGHNRDMTDTGKGRKENKENLWHPGNDRT